MEGRGAAAGGGLSLSVGDAKVKVRRKRLDSLATRGASDEGGAENPRRTGMRGGESMELHKQ